MRADRRDPVIAEIKRYKSVALLVHMRSGDPRTVPVPTKANRWELLSETLAKLDWVRIECLDRDEKLLGIVESDEQADDERDVGEDRDERMAKLISDVVDRTTLRVASMFQAQMGSFVELASATTAGLRAVQETYATALRVQAASMAGQQDVGADGDVMKMLQMASMLQASKPQPTVQARPVMRPRPTPAPRPQKSSSEDAGAPNGTPVKQAS